ncbi:TraV family lipoprotein [Rickettsiales endosymbiont of Peranema trichophorum]|uniref:TraV family lipoprotein n=1 Tax=Rickettsiales endosymbiont of Peranema trichophorum TaxID=2486577 RepID=UPI0013EEB464|nr:TraV family lipoprotein [Rickettsiales endosymbiont of Peranema trichophorum]
MLNKLIIFFMVCVLSSCTVSQEQDCKVGKGTNCKSISEVNAMTSSGELGATDASGDLSGNVPVRLFVDSTYPSDGDDETNSVLRKPEKTGRIWISGFEDKQGNYVEESYIYTILEKGKWVNVR